MRTRTIPLTLFAALALTACAGTPAGPVTPAAPETADSHGAIAGAAEVAEPQLGLTTLAADGTVRHLDLLDESVRDLGVIAPPTSLTSDGRYLFADTDAGLEIVDSGVWTWDHVDHFHYYRAEPRLLGAVPGDGPAAVATTNSSTTGSTGVYFAASGEAVLLDTEALSKGEILERFRLETRPHDGMVVPVGSFALITEPAGTRGGAASVVAYSSEGEPTGVTAECDDARGTITTRVGAVIGCSDSALLALVEGDQLVLERIAYPAGATTPPASAFANREGRPTVAALAGASHIWLLDTRAREWMLLSAPAPLVQVTAVDDERAHVLGLTADGRVVVLDGATGAQLSITEPLAGASLAAGTQPVLIADQQRAYLSAPTEHRLYEIDYADGARIARTFETASAPAFVAETGR